MGERKNAAEGPAVLPVWAVGTPGEPDQRAIRAATREAAVRIRFMACEASTPGDAPAIEGQCECCACTANAGYEATRVPAWDDLDLHCLHNTDWLLQGFDATCARCGGTANAGEGGKIVEGDAVCGSCTTPEDRAIADPKIAAEARRQRSATRFKSPTERVEIPFAFCCSGDAASCDCVNPNHGTVFIDR